MLRGVSSELWRLSTSSCLASVDLVQLDAGETGQHAGSIAFRMCRVELNALFEDIQGLVEMSEGQVAFADAHEPLRMLFARRGLEVLVEHFQRCFVVLAADETLAALPQVVGVEVGGVAQRRQSPVGLRRHAQMSASVGAAPRRLRERGCRRSRATGCRPRLRGVVASISASSAGGKIGPNASHIAVAAACCSAIRKPMLGPVQTIAQFRQGDPRVVVARRHWRLAQ